MHNVSFETTGTKLVITVDIGPEALKAAPPSATGKTRLVGSTGGVAPVPTKNGKAVTFALNVMVKP
jgi:hypothetical protein